MKAHSSSYLFNVYCVGNVVAHGDAREGKWRGNWRMEWVASTLTRPRNVVYPALLTLMRTHRLPAVDWTDSPAYLNGLVRLGERWNVVSARVPSGSVRALQHNYLVPSIKYRMVLLSPFLRMWTTSVWHSAHSFKFIILPCLQIISLKYLLLESSWNVMAHGDAWEGKCRGNWRMEWVASTLHYLGTWCIQHYYHWCAHLGCQYPTKLTTAPI